MNRKIFLILIFLVFGIWATCLSQPNIVIDSLIDLFDVSISAPADNQVFQYESTIGKWQNRTGLTLGTNENVTFGTETFTFDNLSTIDFELSDDVNINDATPHLALKDTTASEDDFEITADGSQFWIANLDDVKKPFLINASNLIQFYEQTGFIFPDGAPSDNQILKYDVALGRMAWEADAGGGGFSVYVEEGDVAKADNTAADIYVDFDSTDFETAVVGNEVNITIPDDGHAHTTTSLSGIDVSADTNLAGDTEIVLTGDALSIASGITRDTEWNTIDFLVGTTTASLTGEMVVGTTPGGSLGGTWASPTIDDLFLLNSASDVMVGTLTADGLTIGNDELITFGSETFAFITAGSVNDFQMTDDLNILDTDPHIRLVPTTGDAFEMYAYGSEVWLTNYTDAGGNYIFRSTGQGMTISGTGDSIFGSDIVPNVHNTLDLGKTDNKWANVWATLVNGADYSFLNGWRLLEAEKYEGYPKGIAIGIEGFKDGIVTEKMPTGLKPLFVITEDFIEYKGIRITAEKLEKLLKLCE